MTDTLTLANGKVVKPTVRVVTLSPAQCEKILKEQNVRNRDIRQGRIEHLAAIIDKGEWRLTGDAIVFDIDGVLLNGQHRLTAAVVANKPIEVVVLKNLPRINQDVMDDTLSRRLADAMKLRGETDVHRRGAGVNWSARMVYCEATGIAHYANNALRPSIPQLLRYYDEHSGLRQSSVDCRPIQRELKLRPGPLIALHYRLGMIDAEHRDVFFNQLRTGEMLERGSPILVFRRYCDRERDRYSARPDYCWVAVGVKAWNAWREGRPISTLSYNYGPLAREKWPLPV